MKFKIKIKKLHLKTLFKNRLAVLRFSTKKYFIVGTILINSVDKVSLASSATGIGIRYIVALLFIVDKIKIAGKNRLFV